MILPLFSVSVSAKENINQNFIIKVDKGPYFIPMELKAESLSLRFPNKYHNLSEVYIELEYFNQTAPDLIDYSFIGLSYWNNSIPLVKLTNERISDDLKGKTYVVAHHHGREHITIEHTIRTIRDLVNGYVTSDKTISDLLDRAIMYFIVTANPDSLDYTLYHNPWQRKNMRPIDDDGDGKIDEDGPNDADGDGYVSAYSAQLPSGDWELWIEGSDDDGDALEDEDAGGGVDLNRNFPYRWNDSSCDSGCTSNTNSQDYQGSEAVSESETRALIDFVNQHNFSHALSLHSGTTIPVFPWGYTNEKKIPEYLLYTEMLNYWQQEQLLPSNYFDESNTDVDYTVAGGWTDWCYAIQHTIPLLLEIYKPLDNSDWRYYENNGTHTIYESDRVFFTPPKSEIENIHRGLYNFEEHWLGLTPSIEIEQARYVKSDDGQYQIIISLTSGSQYFNTTDIAYIEADATVDNLITSYPETLGPFFPSKTEELTILLADEIPDEFILLVNVSSGYASDLHLGINISASSFKSIPGFEMIIILCSLFLLMPILREKRKLLR
jgi:hypothetical protein